MIIGIVQVALSHGGAERVGVMLANGFQQHGHQVFILTDLNERIDYQVDDDVAIVGFMGKNTNSFKKLDCGILCEPDSVETLPSAMEKMMEDESYRRMAQDNAVERSRYYSIENTIERWEVYLNQIINTIS